MIQNRELLSAQKPEKREVETLPRVSSLPYGGTYALLFFLIFLFLVKHTMKVNLHQPAYSTVRLGFQHVTVAYNAR